MGYLFPTNAPVMDKKGNNSYLLEKYSMKCVELTSSHEQVCQTGQVVIIQFIFIRKMKMEDKARKMLPC